MAAHMMAKAFVGKEVRRAREARKMSRAALAERLIVSESLVAAWEVGRQAVKQEYIRQLIDILKFDPYVIERVVVELVNGEAVPEWKGKWLAAEERATSLWSYEPFVMCGLLQTREYMSAVLSNEERVKERLERQKILDSDFPPHLVAVMSESVLRHNVGGPEVMAAQLEYLAECATRDNIIVQIVSAQSEVCAKFRDTFMLITLDDGQDVAYADSVIGGEVIEQPDEIATLKHLFDLYRADALRKSESLDLIRRIADQWKT